MKKKIMICLFISTFLLAECTGSTSKNVDVNNSTSITSGDSDTKLDTIKRKIFDSNTPTVHERPYEDAVEGCYDIYIESFIRDGVNVEYPQIQGLDDKVKEKAINTLIENNLFETQINEQLKEVAEVIKNHGIDEDFYLNLKYEVTLHTDKILSVLYTGTGAFKSSAFPTNSLNTITIDLEHVTTLNLSDFIDVDGTLIQKMKASTNVTNEAIKRGMNKETLFRIIEDIDAADEDFIIECHSGKPEGDYAFAVTPDSLLISIPINHACGDYVIIEVPI